MLRYLLWVRESLNNDAKKRIVVMSFKPSTCIQPAVAPGFCCSDGVALLELKTQLIRHEMRAPTTDCAHDSNHDGIKKLVTFPSQSVCLY